jgi:hypothetical protein
VFLQVRAIAHELSLGWVRRLAAMASFTDSPLRPGARSLHGYWRRSHYRAMADVLVVAAVIVFVAAMLGMTWALGRL